MFLFRRILVHRIIVDMIMGELIKKVSVDNKDILKETKCVLMCKRLNKMPI